MEPSALTLALAVVVLAAMLISCGVLAALVLPAAPVLTESVTLSWPAAGQPARSTTALVVPYRPVELTAQIPCSALAAGEPRTVLATGAPGDGMTVTAGPGGAVLRADDIQLPIAGGPGPQCTAVLHAGPAGWAASSRELHRK